MIAYSRFRGLRITGWLGALLTAGTGLLSGNARAAVTQPDGVVMPLPNPSNEVGLQELFDFKEGPGVLDAQADASTEPATFKPLCDFTAQLLLHETGNTSAFVGWYNSPQTDVAPTTVCDEATGMSSGGGACSKNDIFVLIKGDVANPPFGKAADPLHHPGQIFTGADIASNPYYAGGDIGFVLMSNEGHFSEKRLDPACVGATCTDGDRWIPTIMYASKTIPRGYYMGSEDQNVGPTKWGGNDGDFNDYVFLFTGLQCSGSGEACDTGEPGICAAGLTDCANALGESECRPARTPGTEECNGLDDDCNGDTDEGELCPPGELCVKARCVPLCGTGEFRCDAGQKCVDGACVETACADKTCDAGKVCMGGECIGACDDVVCPTGQSCADGVCVDPCSGIDCGQGFVCEGGACLVECGCAGCAKGECDTESGHCVDDGCAGKACDADQHCSAGDCVDDCADAACPGGAACVAGACEPPQLGSASAGGAGGEGPGDPGIHFGGDGPNGSGDAPGSSEGGNASAGGSNGNVAGDRNALEAKGCSCRSAGGSRSSAPYGLALLGLALLAARRRRHSQ
ncbi:MAG: MYXO-CTERM sorting domain-containing protein [Myxococcales bacterium]